MSGPWTSTRTKVFRFNKKFIKVLKCSAKFKCRPVGKIRWHWVWCNDPASCKSPARWKPSSNGRCCFIQVTRCYVGVARQASSMICNVIRTVIGWKPANKVTFCKYAPGATAWLDAPLSNSSIEQRRMVVIGTEYTLFASLQYDVIFTFANQRFREVCWHNMHIQERRSSGRGSSKRI